MPKKPNKSVKKATTDTVAETVLKDFEAAWKYTQSSWHDRWTNNYKLYHNQRIKYGYEGITDTFVPMTFGTVETMTSALFGSKPKFNFLPPRNKPDQKTDILNAVLDNYWDKDQWSIKVINTGRNFVMLGNGIDYFYWEGDHPCMINVPLRDFFIDPTCTSMEDARFTGRRYLTTVEELKTYEIVDLDNPVESLDEMGQPTGEQNYNMKPKYTNLDKLTEPAKSSGSGGASTDNTDSQEKNNLYGSTLDTTDNQIEVIEYWTNDKTISIANRSVTIEDSENYFKAKAKANGDEYPKGIQPFAAARNYVDPSLFYAKGDVDFIADEQELLNDITNQRIDAVTFVLNPMYTVDPKYGDAIANIQNIPGAVFPFEAGTMERIDMGNVPQDAFNEGMNIKNEMRETTGSNEVVKGASAQTGNATATEINAQIAGAGQRINLKVTQIENEYFHRMARIIFQMIRLYVTEPMLVRIVGKDGARWEQFDPQDFRDGEYEPRVQLDIAIENEKQEQAANAKEMMAAFLNDPDVNQIELKKIVLAKGFQLEPDEVEQLMQPNPAMGQVDPATGQPMQPQTDPATGQPLDPTMQQEQPPMSPEEMNHAMDLLDPSTASDIPSDVALKLPHDATPEELDQVRVAMAGKQ